ncbi:MAG: C39 family peptidase [Ruminococcus sp.]|nr:C39 family peptidase [Ruminococcus sp.]
MKRIIGAAVLAAAVALAAYSCGRTVDKATVEYDEAQAGAPGISGNISDVSDGINDEGDALPGGDGSDPETVTEPELPSAPPTLYIDTEMPDWYELPQSCILDFQAVMQEPELPTGCEVTALDEVLGYYGFDIDKVSLSDYFLPQDFDGWYTMSQRYLGDPHSNNGFGCVAPVIVRTANDYFDYIRSDWYAQDISGTPFRELFYQIEQGRPVVVWATMDLRECYPTYQFTLGCGEELWFDGYHHCVAIYGYDLDEGVVWTADPLVGDVAYSIDQFELIYGIMNMQAVILIGNDESAGVDYSNNSLKYEWMLERHPRWFGLEEEEGSGFEDYYDYDNPVRFEDDRMINVYFD